MLQAGGGHVDLSTFSKSFLSKGSLHDKLNWAWISLPGLVVQIMKCSIASLCHKIATENLWDLLLGLRKATVYYSKVNIATLPNPT